MIKKAASAVGNFIRELLRVPKKIVVDIVTNIPGAGIVKNIGKGIGKAGGAFNRALSVPMGDTSSPRIRSHNRQARFGAYSQSVGMRHSLGGGGLTVTSGVRGHSLGSPMSAHRFGRAEDLVGSGLVGFASRLNRAGGFAEFHGNGDSRHLHAEYPVGDTSSPRVRSSGGGRAAVVEQRFELNIHGASHSVAELEAMMHRFVNKRERNTRERS